MVIQFNAVFVFCVDIHAIYNSELPCLHILILLRSQIRNVVKPYSINCYRTRIYPGTTQILLTTNVNTLLLSINYHHHYHWARSRQLLMSTWTLAINRIMPQPGHNPVNYQLFNQDSVIKTGNHYSLAVNSTESLYQLTIFLQFRL